MKRQHWLASALLTVCCSVLLPMGTAVATPLQVGPALTFDNGGTVTGSFIFDSAQLKVDSWDLTTTAYGLTNPHHYLSSDPSAGSIVLSNTNNDEVISFIQTFPNAGSSAIFELDLVLACFGTANCADFATLNTTYTLVGGGWCRVRDRSVSRRMSRRPSISYPPTT